MTTTGIISGWAYAPVEHKPQITDGKCVAATCTAGGSIGYRPMLGISKVDSEVAASRARADSAGVVPQTLRNLMREIYNAFFKSGPTGSIYGKSPPI